MERGYEEVSNNQDGHRRGTPRETPTIRSLVVVMSAEEMRLYHQVPAKISLEMSNGQVDSTVGEVDDAIYFTREQFAAKLLFPVPSLVKRFLHFTWAPSALVHPNVFQILMGCYVLNSLYQPGLSLVEIYFKYTLKLGIGGRLSMSAYSPRLQFVIELLNSPKTKTKVVVLVRAPWQVMLDSLGLPFDMNQSLLFPGLSHFLCSSYFPRWSSLLTCLCFLDDLYVGVGEAY